MRINKGNGEFTISTDNRIFVKHSRKSPFIFLGRGEENIEMYRGNFDINDYVVERKPLLNFEVIDKDPEEIEVIFEDELKVIFAENKGLINIKFETINNSYNRFWLRITSVKNEKIYGLGEQMSYFNLKGREYPVWTSEPGVGRDKNTYITWRSDVENKAGGDYYNSNFPQPTFVSLDRYFVHLDSTAYSKFNFENTDFTEIEVWEIPEKIIYSEGNSLLDTVIRLSDILGKQVQLPDWAYNGLVIGAQGGTKRVKSIVEKAKNHDVQIAALWCQDWCGKKETSFGRRLKWNWEWDEDEYPGLPSFITELEDSSIKFLGYINPYLLEGTSLYKEAEESGYFALNEDKQTYLVDFGEFYCGIVDFTNPEAFNWFKEVIKNNMIDFGLDGWMADFGEYLPIDVKLSNGKSPMIEHNNWPVLWAKCNYEALKETGNLGKILYFMRAGGTGSQKYCTLLWAGDQSVDFSIHDGLISVVKGAISSAVSGIGLTHSDIGGYTSLFGNIRTKELFIRWAEMATFSPLMRTHEGNRPDDNFQFYDDDETLDIMALLTKVHKSLEPYLRSVVNEAVTKGIGAQRPLVFHYEEDENVHELDDQYLLGQDMLIAPIYLKGNNRRTVYLPDDEWIYLWENKEYSKGYYEFEAPFGKPVVFYRKESKFCNIFSEIKNIG